MRRSLQSEVPIAAAMEKPDTEKGSADAVRPGAAAYYDNNEKSFMDQYGDWLYISAGLGSVIAAMFGLTRAREWEDSDDRAKWKRQLAGLVHFCAAFTSQR